MKKLTNSVSSLVNLAVDKEERTFEYVMNKKRANTKLLKAAKRIKNLEVEVKSNCVNLRFNDGSYYEVVLPLIKEWQDNIGHDLVTFACTNWSPSCGRS